MIEEKLSSCATETGECSLSPSDFSQRVEDWKALASETISRKSYEGKVISTYPASSEIRQRLSDLISAEAACCPFLEFDLRDRPDSIEVELRYPPDFESVIVLVAPEVIVSNPSLTPATK
jgi:hypothetical protein